MDFFRPDSEIMIFLGKAADFIVLNLLCLFCSIPVITIGAAFTARNYAAMKIVRREEPDAVKSYFKSFRENFKQITAVWSGCLVVIGILGYDWYNVLWGTSKNMVLAGKIALLVMSFILWAVIYCMFYFEARFKVSTGELVKASMLMAVLNFPKMVVILASIMLSFLICAWYINWGLGIWFFTSTTLLYFISRDFNAQLDRLIKGEEQNEGIELG